MRGALALVGALAGPVAARAPAALPEPVAPPAARFFMTPAPAVRANSFAPLARPAGVAVDKAELRFARPINPLTFTALYPQKALTNGERGQVTIRCRVEVDRTLFCHDGAGAPGVAPGIAGS